MSEDRSNDIAVVGIACRFPGARDPDTYWRNLLDRVESIRDLSDEDLDAAGVTAAERAHPDYVRRGGPLENFDHFDPSFFGISARDAEIMDPQHRQFLTCSWEAFERAGYDPARFDGQVGVFGGSGANLYLHNNVLANPSLVDSLGFFHLRHTGNDKDFLSTFVSYKLDLKGPAINVQTACSTSLVAIHLASQSLISRECDMALAGGSTLANPHTAGYRYRASDLLSPDGRCRAFDAGSNGTVFGSGTGIVVLRRLQDAIDAGDHIHAVIIGSAVNNDGAGKMGFFAPSVEGQAEAIAEAIDVAGVSADTIGLVETHGTGTPIGDPIEVLALNQAFRESSERTNYCALGSVKPNIGHLDTAAGVASFIKAVYAVEQRTLPPSLHYDAPNPEIDFASSPFYVSEHPQEWPERDTPRRVAINSLGVGGTNAHVIVEEAPSAPAGRSEPSRQAQVLALSARSRDALERTGRRMATELTNLPDDALDSVAHTLQTGRRAFEIRCVLACKDREEAVELLSQPDPRRVFTQRADPSVDGCAFLLPGGGTHYAAMGAGLYASEPVFRQHIDAGLGWIESNGHAPGLREAWGIHGSGADEAQLSALSLQLPAIFLTEFALARLWRSWGIEPRALLGHSLGENTAACLAGVLSFEAALGLVCLRGRLFESVRGGGTLSVHAPAADVQRLLGADLDLACINGARHCVVSGPIKALYRIEAQFDARELTHQRMNMNFPAHSAMLDPILDEFRSYLDGIELCAPAIPILSNRTGTWLTDAEATSPDYWVRQLRETVQFADGVSTLLEDPSLVLLEVGPGRGLSSHVREHASAAGRAILPTMRHAEESVDDSLFARTAFGRVWAAGVEVDWARLRGALPAPARIPLPPTAMDERRCWIEGRPQQPGETDELAADVAGPLKRFDRVEDGCYRPRWVDVAPSKASASKPSNPRCWLVFIDAVGLGSQVIRELEACGDTVIVVREGDTYYRRSDREYVLAPEIGRDGYDALFRDLAERELVPDRIAHFWSVTGGDDPVRRTTFLHRCQDIGFYSLFFAAQALENAAPDHECHIVVVSDGMQGVAAGELQHPEKATLLGPIQVLPKEIPTLSCSSIDVVVPEVYRNTGRGLGALTKQVLRELNSEAGNKIVALRDDRRLERRLVRAELEAAEANGKTAPALREGGIVLITGGFGGLGLEAAKMLVREAHSRVVLLGRREIPPRVKWDAYLETPDADAGVVRVIHAVREMENAGGEVLLCTGDVARGDQLDAVLAQAHARFGAIQGVIHAAGTLDDGPLLAKTPASIERVFSAKVHGTEALMRALKGTELDFFALFSSTSALIAPAGQVDYAAANAYLDAVAVSHDAPMISLAWGVWADVGIAYELERELCSPELPASAPPLPARSLLGECREAGPDTFIYDCVLGARDHWSLAEHRLGSGIAVLPGTGTLELARAAHEAATSSKTLALSEVAFSHPLEVPDEKAQLIRIELKREAGSDGDRFHFVVRSRPEAAGHEDWTDHATGISTSLVGKNASAPADLDPAAIRARCTAQAECSEGRALALEQGNRLQFGERWSSLRAWCMGEKEMLLEFELPEAFATDLDLCELHPALLDIATGNALRLIEGYEPGKAPLYVPMAYESVRVYGPLPAKALSWVRGRKENTANRPTGLFDICIADPSGAVVVEVTGFALARVDEPAPFAPLATRSLGESARPRGTSEAQQQFVESVALGIRTAEGMPFLGHILAQPQPSHLVVTSLNLHQQLAHARVADAGARPSFDGSDPALGAARPNLLTEYREPSGEIECALAGFWGDLLGVGAIGADDDFFELGGHSLVAVRLFAKIKKRWGVEYPLSVLFEAPTISRCAALLRGEVGEDAELNSRSNSAGDARSSPAERPTRERKDAHRFLVEITRGEMGSGVSKRPFFVVGGMLGNVLNVRHLAALLGDDQPFYGVQAQGLHGEAPPHRSFEDMADAYLSEILSVQPHGPYLLGGYSGGGITALEMAQRLRKRGERVEMLALFDTPCPAVPVVSRADKIRIHLQRLRREGLDYVTHLRSQGATPPAEPGMPVPVENLIDERGTEIAEAFKAALATYQMQRYAGDILVYRPRLRRIHELSRGRAANAHWRLVEDTNHWRPWVDGRIDVIEVAGDHHDMMLEPNVRELASDLKVRIHDIQSRLAEDDETSS